MKSLGFFCMVLASLLIAGLCTPEFTEAEKRFTGVGPDGGLILHSDSQEGMANDDHLYLAELEEESEAPEVEDLQGGEYEEDEIDVQEEDEELEGEEVEEDSHEHEAEPEIEEY